MSGVKEERSISLLLRLDLEFLESTPKTLINNLHATARNFDTPSYWTLTKLPSGSWRVQIFSHYEFVQQPDGSVKKKRIYESFTCDDPSNRGKREAERLAAEYAATKERINRTDYTLQEAMEKYIASKENVLSTTTLRGYKTLLKNAYPKLLSLQDPQADSF